MNEALSSDRSGIIIKLRADFPDLRFITGRRFAFRPPRTIVIPHERENRFDSLLVLHEVGHALIRRFDFKTEIERLKIEVLAWEKARELCGKYGVFIDSELIQSELDSYRDFLHQKSRCPICGLTRFQTPDKVWHCPRCDVIF